MMSHDGAGKPWHRGIVQQERWERLAKGGTALCNSLQRVSLSVAALQGFLLQEKKKKKVGKKETRKSNLWVQDESGLS